MSEQYQVFIRTWKAIHADKWKKFAGEANEKLLLEGAMNFRPCLTAVDRSFALQSFARTDGHDVVWDSEQETQRTTAQNAELENSTTVDADFISYIMSLSQSQISAAYYNDPSSEFSRKYRFCVAHHGFRLPVVPDQPSQREPFARRGVQQ